MSPAQFSHIGGPRQRASLVSHHWRPAQRPPVQIAGDSPGRSSSRAPADSSTAGNWVPKKSYLGSLGPGCQRLSLVASGTTSH